MAWKLLVLLDNAQSGALRYTGPDMIALAGTILRVGVVVGVALLLSACARIEAASGSARHSWTIPHVLRIVDSEEPDSLNPIVGYLQTDVHVSMFWAGYLFNWSDRNRFVPELATVLPTVANHGISADGKTITYHLRRGVRWQDGAPFSADDVIFSYRAVMNPQNAVQSRSGYELITRIDKIDDATIVIHLKHAWGAVHRDVLYDVRRDVSGVAETLDCPLSRHESHPL